MFFLNNLKDTLEAVLPFPKTCFDRIFAGITASVSKFIFKHPISKKTVFKGLIKGTVFSGSPTRTTLGNSLRVYLYWKWIL